MRQDMKKVLCESPRTHSKDGYNLVRAKETRGELEDLPYYQGMRRPFMKDYSEKDFTDHIAPLYRYLWSCIGRVWNDVWSEICRTVPSNNTVDRHLKGHIESEIEIHTYLVDNEVWVKGSSRGVFGLYVDPRDGTVQASQKDRKALWRDRYGNDNKPVTLVSLNRYEDAMKISGIWYRITYDIVPPARIVTYIEDGETKTKQVPEFRKDAVYGHSVSSGNGHTRYRATKQQIASNDLRKHNLMNDR